MHTETITWYTPAERLPDADLTVLVRMPEGWDEPVTQGYLDGDEWREADGSPIAEPLLWAELPTGEEDVEPTSPPMLQTPSGPVEVVFGLSMLPPGVAIPQTGQEKQL